MSTSNDAHHGTAGCLKKKDTGRRADSGQEAAIILDGPPWPVTALLPDKCFHFNATGPDGAWFHIECSPDAIHWTPLCTNQVVGGSIDFVDPDAPGDNARFYRAVPELNPPAQ